ncbi:MAG: hypothetical protein EPN22_00765 [Nitrospirae bacterium]|nr:MAG: hypothetical protein EPN22_00765 [Nitrospirota bacterium]
MDTVFLKALVIIFSASAVMVYVLHRLNVPSIVGFLIAGVVIGPYGIGLVKDIHSVEVLAELGVILLLFTIGIEFSTSRLGRMKKAIISGGGSQVLLTIGLSSASAYLLTERVEQSVFIGFLIALSSTAVVLKILSDRGETDTPHGRMMLGILICQDLCVVPLMLLVPILSGEGNSIIEVMLKMGKAALIVGLVLLSSRWIVPSVLHKVVHTRSRELFITTIILLCLGIALLTAEFGLSLALGAFLAGIIISESEYAHQATSDILPFKDSFIGMFFVSTGMLMDIGFFVNNFFKITIAVAIILVLKTTAGLIASLIAGAPSRSAVHAGLGIAQIGEFSFVLAVTGKASGLINDNFYQLFLSSSVVTMMLTPFVLMAAPSLSAWITARHLLAKAGRRRNVSEAEGSPRKKQDHVIIIGFGLNGRNLVRVLKETGIPYVVLEMNSDTVREMKKKGEPIYYGDGTSRELLHKIGLERARLLVIAISDPAATRRTVSIARHENPGIEILVRTRYVSEIDDLKSLGANEVIPEEFETSIEIFSKVLHKYNFPNNIILDMVEKIRSDSYTALRGGGLHKSHLFEKYSWLPDMEIDGYMVTEGSRLVGNTIAGLQVRKKTGSTIIAVRRGSEVHTNPSPDFSIRAGDIILFTGNRDNMNAALTYFVTAR